MVTVLQVLLAMVPSVLIHIINNINIIIGGGGGGGGSSSSRMITNYLHFPLISTNLPFVTSEVYKKN
jgi:hypothetical protein